MHGLVLGYWQLPVWVAKTSQIKLMDLVVEAAGEAAEQQRHPLLQLQWQCLPRQEALQVLRQEWRPVLQAR